MPRIGTPPDVTQGAALVAKVTRTAVEAKSPSDAAHALEALLEQPDLWGGAKGNATPLPEAAKAPLSTDQLKDQAQVLSRRLESTLRALRREVSGRASPAAVRVLAQDALRLLIDAMGTRRLGELLAGGGGRGAVALQGKGDAGTAALLQGLLTSSRPDRHRAMVSLLLTHRGGARADDASPKPLNERERSALADILTSLDPSHGSFVREKLAGGASVDEVRHLLVQRLVPVTLEEAPPAQDDAKAAAAAGLKFDLGINKFVQNDRSWRYEVRLAQLFEYVVDGVIDGREELKARLVSSSIDPATGDAAIDEATVSAFVEDLAAALHSNDPALRKLLDQRFDMIFSTTDGGDKPVAALWDLPVRVVADLFAAMSDPALVQQLHGVAEGARADDLKRTNDVKAPLAALLQRYPGIPRRHKRAHAALINMGLAGQSVGEMGREGGVLPRSKTLLDPKILKERYADAEDLKMRFLFTDELEMFVLSDADFEAVVKKWGFPPNHELLSYNRPIAGSGYVKIDHGRIVALEDDVVMLKGKLPDGLPPALEILRARGFELDEAGIEKSSHVLDFETFKALAKGGDLPTAPQGDAAHIARVLLETPHVDRPALAVAVVRARLRDAIKGGATESEARSRLVPFVAEALGGLHIINTSRKDFREGLLPQHLNESSDLHIDASLADHLLRLVQP